jgi:hypothetical protein
MRETGVGGVGWFRRRWRRQLSCLHRERFQRGLALFRLDSSLYLNQFIGAGYELDQIKTCLRIVQGLVEDLVVEIE